VACRMTSPLLAAILLVSLLVFTAWHVRREACRAPPAGLSIACLLAIYATIVYGLLQSDPRYSIPFRSCEMLIVATACRALIGMKRDKVQMAR